MLTEVKNNLKIMFLSLKYNLIRVMENRVSFLTSVSMMIFNNASFIIQWLTIFTLVEYIGSYTLNDIMLFWGISSGSYGLTNILFNGANKIPEYIENGKLDAYLVMPKNVLCHVITSSTEPSAWGDLIYGYIALIIFNFSIKNIFLYSLLIIIGALIYASFIIICNSFTFYFIRFSETSEILKDIFINGSLYPDVIFNRAIKIIFFTLIPCALASWVPVHLIIEFNIYHFILLILATNILIIIAFFLFYQGLKRYTSSNLMEARS